MLKFTNPKLKNYYKACKTNQELLFRYMHIKKIIILD